ncbi:hypothetical protein [Kitasatospora sp. NPDC091207]|uniref:hypothetical protein n=1 Tax=Kitasatospora sp. NPDC091207 TaxID=3364083 RepID=UPI003816C302
MPPAVNDPTTATQVLDRSEAFLHTPDTARRRFRARHWTVPETRRAAARTAGPRHRRAS